MSGVFWEADKQPNLCEAASGFTMSTVNLAVAIPMAVVDLVVMLIMTISGVCGVVLSPVLAQAGVLVTMLLEMLGLEEMNSFNMILTTVIGGVLMSTYLVTRGKTNACQKTFSRLSFNAQALMLLYGFLTYSAEAAVYPKLVQLALTHQFAILALDSLFKEFNNFGFESQTNALDEAAAGIKKILELESGIALLVGVFGLPSFSDQDDVTQYYSIVPLIAMHLVYMRQVRANTATEDTVDHVNGEVTVVKEAPASESPQESDAKPQEAGEETTAEADKTADGSTVENIADEKTEALIKRLQTCLGNLISKVTGLIAPLTNIITKTLSMISSLPWSSLTLCSTVNITSILVSMAWLSLTSNILAAVLPVFSLCVPLILNKVDKIPAQFRPYLAELNTLALGTVQFCLITGVSLTSSE